MRNVFIVAAFFITNSLFAQIIYTGAHEKIKTIHDAIKAAKEKDTLIIRKGIYKEGNIFITKPLTIIGEAGAVLDGENKNEILTLSGKNITIKNLEFRNSGYSSMNDYASIKIIDATNIVIENNKIINAYFAIHFSNSSYFYVRNNTIKGSPKTEQTTGNGIHLWKCHHATIEKNNIQGQRDGIYFEFVTESIIQNNISENNIRYGLHFMFSNSDRYLNNTFKSNGAGVAVMYSNKVTMMQNHFEQNWGTASYGILLKEISDSHIEKNRFIKNTVGIYAEGTNRCTINNNEFRENGWALKVQASCNENIITKNNFFGNSFDVATNGSLVLNTFNSNYWDKYEGYDLNKDGIGDVPYRPVSLYAMIIEKNPNAIMLMHSFTATVMDKAEKAMPGIIPENLLDNMPYMKPIKQ